MEDDARVPQPRRRKPWLAVLLSLIATGLGQLYNGQWRKALLFFAAETVLGCALFPALGSFAGLLAGVGALLTFNLYALADAYRMARRLPDYRPGPCNRGWVYALAAIIGLGTGAAVQELIQASFYENYKAPSGSMIPTLLVGDHFMADVLAPSDPVRRGDVVVFLEETSGKHFVKRVVGLPGEAVSLEGQRVLIDGVALDEPHARHIRPGERLPVRDEMAPVRLGPDEYFVMGDNRERSYDSRWLGPIRRDRMRARALYIYFPGAAPEGSRFSRLGAAIR